MAFGAPNVTLLIFRSSHGVKGVTGRGRLSAECNIRVLTGRWVTDHILAKFGDVF